MLMSYRKICLYLYFPPFLMSNSCVCVHFNKIFFVKTGSGIHLVHRSEFDNSCLKKIKAKVYTTPTHVRNIETTQDLSGVMIHPSYFDTCGKHFLNSLYSFIIYVCIPKQNSLSLPVYEH